MSELALRKELDEIVEKYASELLVLKRNLVKETVAVVSGYVFNEMLSLEECKKEAKAIIDKTFETLKKQLETI